MLKLRFISMLWMLSGILEAARPHRWIEIPFGNAKLAIRGFAEAPDGTLTIASSERLYRFDGKQIQPLDLKMSSPLIQCLTYTKAGELIVGTATGFWVVDGSAPRHIPSPSVANVKLSGDRIGATVVSSKGTQFALLKPNPWRVEAFEPILSDANLFGLENKGWRVICGLQVCDLTVREERLQITVAPEAWKGRNEFFERLNSPGNSLPSFMDIAARSPTLNCTVETHTVACLDGATVLRFRLPDSIRGSVSHLHLDRFGVMWLAIDGYGLMGLVAEPGLEQFGAEQGLPATPYHFRRIANGDLIAATSAGLFRFVPSSQSWERFGKKHGIGRHAVLLPVPQGVLVSESNTEIQLRGFRGELLRRWVPANPAHRSFRSLIAARDGSIYTGTAALLRLPSLDENSRFVALPLPREGRVKDMLGLPDGRLAIAYLGGFAVGRPGDWIQVDERHGLRQAPLESVALGEQPGEYWVTFDNGIGFARIQLDPAGRPTVSNYGKAEGFSDDHSYDIYLSRRKHVWRGAQRSISFAETNNIEAKNWKVWDTSGGLSNPDTAMNSIFEDEDGSLLVGTEGGAVRLSGPAAEFGAAIPLQVFAKVTSANPAIVDLAHRYLVSPNMVHFDYRRRGTSAWISTDQDRLELGGLPAGIHNFEVRVSPSRFFTPANTAIVEIEVARPPVPVWMQWLAPAAVISALLGLWAIRYYLLAWIPLPRCRQWAERHWFTNLKHDPPADRELVLRKTPRRFRERMNGLFATFSEVETGEDDRTRSGMMLDSKYLLEHVIAKGGFATVYIAQDLQQGRAVAVKLFHRSHAPGAWLDRRLSAEIEAMRRIDHPNVLRLLESGATPDSRPYLVVEYIRGINLRQALRTGPLPLRRALDRVLECCDALEHVHSLGILHRDLKPENILLENAGAVGEKAILIDFGVATIYDSLHDGAQSTFFAASLDYVAPEQIGGLKLETSDVYSLGLILFELLTGLRFKAAFGGNATIEGLREEMTSRGLPAELAECLMAATALEHSRRFATVAQFRRCLHDCSVRNR